MNTHPSKPRTPSQENPPVGPQNLQRNPPLEGASLRIQSFRAMYPRTQLIAEGHLKDLSKGPFRTLCQEYFNGPVAVTSAVWGLIETAVKNPRFCNTYSGLIHDIFYMCKRGRMLDAYTRLFCVVIKGAGRRSLRTLKSVTQFGDNGELVITIMLLQED